MAKNAWPCEAHKTKVSIFDEKICFCFLPYDLALPFFRYFYTANQPLRQFSSMGLFDSKIKFQDAHLFPALEDCAARILSDENGKLRKEEDALMLLSSLKGLGVSVVYLTPQISEDTPHKTVDLMLAAQRLRTQVGEDFTICLGASYMIDDVFRYRLEQEDLLPLGKDRSYVLVETFTYNSPPDFYDIFSRIQEKGFTPLLMHPERYMYLQENDLRRLNQLGVQMMVSLPGLMGMYGDEAQRKAQWLLDEGLVLCLGTEVQSDAQICALEAHTLRKNTVRRLLNLPGLLERILPEQ